MSEQEKVFPQGMIFKTPEEHIKEKMPWLKGKISIKVEEFVAFLGNHVKEDGWINIDLKVSKAGKPYLELNTWKPQKKEVPKVDIEEEIKPEDL